jgi:cytoskeletal protein CcmA (bactofilin family)
MRSGKRMPAQNQWTAELPAAAQPEPECSYMAWMRKDDEKPATPTPKPPVQAPSAAPSYQPARTAETPRMDSYRADVAHIGKSVIIKGELSGSEDLYLDGQVEGSIDLRDHSLIVGPNSQVRASIFARDVSIQGKVDGNVIGVNRVELKKSALLNGNIDTQRIVIEDGAFFKGSIDIRKGEPAKPQTATAAGTPVPSTPVPSTPPPSVPVSSEPAVTAPVTAEQNK